jgi:subtilisin family serine protease
MSLFKENSMQRIHRNLIITLRVGGILLCGLLTSKPAHADQHIGINVLLKSAPTDALLADLGQHGQVTDVIPEINAVTLNADASELPAIQALSYVAGANPDRERAMAQSGGGLPVSDFAGGANQWSLDAINVTDFGGGRTVSYDGTGVYVAVMDTGLVHNWRAYFPEQRIATQFARSFGGGGGEKGTVSEQPDKWEHDTISHGTAVTSILLGFHYAGPEALPADFNGVAPKVSVIPVKICNNNSSHALLLWSSVCTRGLLYLTNLKTSGALGNAPLVVNMSFSGFSPDIVERAAIDYAIASGVVIVAAAGNEGENGGSLGTRGGMTYPAAYAPVISVASVGWIGEFPMEDPTIFPWILRDVPENDASQFFIAPDSSRELPGQQLDVAAPGWMIPVAWTQNGQVDYTFIEGTSHASPHVVGIAALMLQKNPHLTQAQIAAILESTALPLPPGCRDVIFPGLGPGNPPTFSDHSNGFLFPFTVCWGANATGHGLVQADAALAATPLP